MEHGRSNADPLLDEEDTKSGAPIPSSVVTEGDDSRILLIGPMRILMIGPMSSARDNTYE
jgi:hypothetical protein